MVKDFSAMATDIFMVRLYHPLDKHFSLP